ncbi:retrovirus-related pol polyprotein from transposon TNT 1-94 [Tanacetum coccineum]
MSVQLLNLKNDCKKDNQEKNNESLTAELERYKERVKTFEQRLNIDLITREKMIDSQMDDMIMEKLALKQQIDSLEQNLSTQIKEKESLLQTFTVFKNESKEKENKYMDKEIDLEKKIKELDYIIYKVDFGKHFVPQQELSAEQAFWLQTSNPNTEQFDISARIEAPSKLHKDKSCDNKNALEIPDYFKNNDLKAQLQAKDTTICKLKEHIKSRKENNKEEKVKQDIDEIKTINIEMEHSVAKLLSKNERLRKEVDHLKQIYKDQFDVFQIVLWYMDSECSKHMTWDRSQLMNFVSKFLGTVRFGNNQITKIMVYGDYQLRNVTISRNLDGVDLLSGSRDTNLYTISLADMLKTSLICLLSKASKTKSWLWHHWLSHLNLACALGKSKKSSHHPKAKDTNQEKLYLLHMDLCGLMRVESINGKKYILVIVDDYSRFTWVKIFRSKDEAPDAIIKCIKNIQVHFNATVRNVRTDNGTEFVNQTLREFYENVSISHQTCVAYTLQQNGIVESEDLGKLNAKADIGLGLQLMTPATSSSGLVPNPVPQQPLNPPNRNDWDRLFQPMFDEYFNPPQSVVSLVPVVVAPRAVDIVCSPSSKTIDLNAPSSITSSTNQQQQSSIISQRIEELIPYAHFDDPCHEPLHDVSTSQESSSNVQSSHSPLELIGRWTKDHPLANLKNFKEAMTEPSWIDAMQEEIHEFEPLQVWELVPCPDRIMLIKLKWIFKVKTDEFGGALKNKARLVAQGFRQ